MNRWLQIFSKRRPNASGRPADNTFWAGVAVLVCVAIAGVIAVRVPSGSAESVLTTASSRSASSDPVGSTLAKYASTSSGSYSIAVPEEESYAWKYGLCGATILVGIGVVVYILRRQSDRIAQWKTRRRIRQMTQADDLSTSFAKLASAPRPTSLAVAVADDEADIGVMPVPAGKQDASSMHIDASFDVNQYYVPDEPESL